MLAKQRGSDKCEAEPGAFGDLLECQVLADLRVDDSVDQGFTGGLVVLRLCHDDTPCDGMKLESSYSDSEVESSRGCTSMWMFRKRNEAVRSAAERIDRAGLRISNSLPGSH